MEWTEEKKFMVAGIAVLACKQGIMRAFLSWLTLVGNCSLITKSSTVAYNVVTERAGVADLFIWFSALFVLIAITPKILNLNGKAEEFFIKVYTVIINTALSLMLIYCLFHLMHSNGYTIAGDSCSSGFEGCQFYWGEDFHFINSLLLIYTFLWGFAVYINRLLPSGYLNYASAPMFIILCLSLIYSSTFIDTISVYNYFNSNPWDGMVRLFYSLVVIGFYVYIVRRTVFSSLYVDHEKKQNEGHTGTTTPPNQA